MAMNDINVDSVVQKHKCFSFFVYLFYQLLI